MGSDLLLALFEGLFVHPAHKMRRGVHLAVVLLRVSDNVGRASHLRPGFQAAEGNLLEQRERARAGEDRLVQADRRGRALVFKGFCEYFRRLSDFAVVQWTVRR